MIGGSWRGTFFLLLFAVAARLVSPESGCLGNDVAGKLFWEIKNLSSCCLLVAIKFFSHFIGECQCKYAVRLEMKSSEEVCRMPLTNQAPRNKTL